MTGGTAALRSSTSGGSANGSLSFCFGFWGARHDDRLETSPQGGLVEGPGCELPVPQGEEAPQAGDGVPRVRSLRLEIQSGEACRHAELPRRKEEDRQRRNQDEIAAGQRPDRGGLGERLDVRGG